MDGVLTRLRALAIVCGGAVIAIVATAYAAEPVRVVVVATGAGDPVAARLIDELVTAGVTVEVTAEQGDPLTVLSRTRGARAIVRVDPSRRAVRIWTGESSQPETLGSEPGGDVDTAARALALRVVEVLRPRLLPSEAPSASASASAASSIPWPPTPLPPPSAEPSAQPAGTGHPAPRPAHGDADTTAPPPTPKNTPQTQPRPDDLAIYIAPAMVLHPATGLSPSAGALWGASKMVFPYGGVDVCALVPVIPGFVAGPAGQVKVAMGAIGAGALFRYPAPPSAVTAWLGVGIAAGFVGYDAQAASTEVRASNGVVAHALPYARAGVEWRAWPSLGFRADAVAAIARPRPVLQIAGEPDMPLAEPLVTLSVGIVAWVW